jgi:hypothetical protein
MSRHRRRTSKERLVAHLQFARRRREGCVVCRLPDAIRREVENAIRNGAIPATVARMVGLSPGRLVVHLNEGEARDAGGRAYTS